MELKGKEGELRGVIEIKRAETGKIEKYDFVGKIGDGENSTEETILKEHNNVSNTLNSGA